MVLLLKYARMAERGDQDCVVTACHDVCHA
jgi:hypothetical protein